MGSTKAYNVVNNVVAHSRFVYKFISYQKSIPLWRKLSGYLLSEPHSCIPLECKEFYLMF